MTLTALDQRGGSRSPWFVSWFDSIHYHKLYAYRNDAEAAGFVDHLLQHLEPANGSAILDLGCGAGRHSKYLASKGFRVTGIDLAAGSIKEAKRWERPGLAFFQHDMRVPFRKNTMEYVFNFFTSFGYFEDAAEHLMVVRNMADSLKVGGRLVLDYLNVGYAEARVVPTEVRTIEATTYRIARWSNSTHFFKRITVEDTDQGKCGEYVEHVAKFSVDNLRYMFNLCGLSIEAVCGDYRLSSYDPHASPRMILMARKTTSASKSNIKRREK